MKTQISALAHKSKDNKWWLLDIVDTEIVTQVKNFTQAKNMVADAYALMFDVPIESLEVTIVPQIAEVTNFLTKWEKVEKQRQEILEEQKILVHEMTKQYTVREIGQLLGISPQRVSQINKKIA